LANLWNQILQIFIIAKPDAPTVNSSACFNVFYEACMEVNQARFARFYGCLKGLYRALTDNPFHRELRQNGCPDSPYFSVWRPLMALIHSFRCSLIAAALTLVPSVHAQPGALPDAPPMAAHGMQGPTMHGPGMQGPGMPMLSGLNLSETQQDKLFQIHYQQAPVIYVQLKAARKAHEALQALVGSTDFSVAKARELAQAEAQANAELAFLHAQAQFQTLSLLSPEQRKEFEATRASEPFEGAHGMPPVAGGMPGNGRAPAAGNAPGERR
jgi:protein CpxP